MKIKRQISFKLRKYGKSSTSFQIQMHVTYQGERLVFSTGNKLDSDDAWNSEEQLVKKGYIGSDGATELSINTVLRELRDHMEMTFQYFEVNGTLPTMAQVNEKYNERIGVKKPTKVKRERPKTVRVRSNSFYDVFDSFTHENGEKNAWTDATFEKMAALKEDLLTFNKNLNFADLDEAGLTDFVCYLRDDKVLKTPRKKKGDRTAYDREDTIGLKNSTIRKKLDFLKWFLNWATDRGYNDNLAYKTFKPTLKATQKKVIYLTKDELEKLKNFEIPKNMIHLENVRDVFLFCCFSGLRHSDAYNLRWIDVKEDHLEVTTVKTADSLSIELNSVTRSILHKYKGLPIPGGKALPVITNQAMNRDLKELCRMAGINEQIRITTYKGNQRIDEIKEKWELVGTHTGRRTFIVTCLSLGIPPNIVMKWTGHSDYKSMKPYIDIVDSIKASEMTKLDSVL